MTKNNLALAASIMAMVAISGQAFAGTTKANASPEAVSLSTAQATRAFSDSHAAMATETAAPNAHRYHGGPKSND